MPCASAAAGIGVPVSSSPTAYETSPAEPSDSRSAVSGGTKRFSKPDTPGPTPSCAAVGPTSNSFERRSPSSGRMPPSFLSSTAPCAASLRANCACASTSIVVGPATRLPSRNPNRSICVSTRPAARSSTRTSTCFASMACLSRASPLRAFAAGEVHRTLPRHLHVETRGDRRRAAVRVPIGHDEPLPAQLFAQQAGQVRLVLRIPEAVVLVVGGHDRRDARAHRALEPRQVDLVQRALVDDEVEAVRAADAAALVERLVVGDEVLGGRQHAGRLDAADLRGGHARDDERILAGARHVAAPVRQARDVHHRTEQHVVAGRARLAPENLAVLTRRDRC